MKLTDEEWKLIGIAIHQFLEYNIIEDKIMIKF